MSMLSLRVRAYCPVTDDLRKDKILGAHSFKLGFDVERLPWLLHIHLMINF